ncbi:GNAT family N-acetyltransferase [Yinghuangia seranimata]|uniref:GNAT family N-acetyltransferase n=1 Tax=Yinghuangia seranimata TaxID=408067 RepID=UPI00248C9EA0|nr:GNAT family N-acetyltransferase [Yinghuangia seranimata]MDI2126541.1 GNAT family N-acetyltransferase [Yinghuangia seranimata]
MTPRPAPQQYDALDPASEPVLELRHLPITHPAADPLLRALEADYAERYGSLADGEMTLFEPDEFAPPHGAFVLLFEDGEAIAGGAYRRYDDHTAELKRIWTHTAHRRRGLARRVLEALEHSATTRGYHRLYLTTGPRQPEAVGLYLSTGYTPLFDVDEPPFAPLPFEKALVA